MGNEYKRFLDKEVPSIRFESAVAIIIILLIIAGISYIYYYDIPEILPSNRIEGTVTKLGMSTSSKYDLPSIVVHLKINGNKNIKATNPKDLPVKPGMKVIIDVHTTQYSGDKLYKIREIIPN